MNGEIEVKSKLGQGTTFQIRLPITRKAPINETHVSNNQPMATSQTATPVFNQNDLEKYVVLIVEDNPDVIHYLGNILQDKFSLLIASNGQDGIDRAIQDVPDLIISDVMMPIKDGYQLCDTLKNDIRTSHIPIILLTARADIDSKLQGLRRGADAYLPKPFHQDELMIRIDALIQMRLKLQERYRSTSSTVRAPDPMLDFEDQFINNLNSLLADQLSDEDYDIQQICEDLHISRSQLHKKLKALTGMPTSHYIRNYKLIAAESLLLNPEFNISEVAYQVGFKSPKYFTKLFKERNGLSPTDWIAKCAKNPL
jgi:YesN/AraC family two-component response regulator